MDAAERAIRQQTRLCATNAFNKTLIESVLSLTSGSKMWKTTKFHMVTALFQRIPACSARSYGTKDPELVLSG